MGMSMPTLIKTTLGTVESGCHITVSSVFWELIPLLYNSIAKVISTDIQSKPFRIDFERLIIWK